MFSRPLCASRTDKLELQECLHSGRVAKADNLRYKKTKNKTKIHIWIWLHFLTSTCCRIVWKTKDWRPALPCADERQGGHTVVHRAGEVTHNTHSGIITRQMLNLLTKIVTLNQNWNQVFDVASLVLQDPWVSSALHGRCWHGAGSKNEAPGSFLECASHQASLCPTQRLLWLWIEICIWPGNAHCNII